MQGTRGEGNPSARSELGNRRILGDITRRKIEYYLGKNAVTDLDLYNIVREFFREYLELKYEFSVQELIKELQKVFIESRIREKLVPFLERVSEIEYKDNPFPEEQVRVMLGEFSEYVSLLVSQSIKIEKPGFFARLFGSGKKPKENHAQIPQQKPAEQKKQPAAEPQKSAPEQKSPLPMKPAQQENKQPAENTDNMFEVPDIDEEMPPKAEEEKEATTVAAEPRPSPAAKPVSAKPEEWLKETTAAMNDAPMPEAKEFVKEVKAHPRKTKRAAGKKQKKHVRKAVKHSRAKPKPKKIVRMKKKRTATKKEQAPQKAPDLPIEDMIRKAQSESDKDSLTKQYKVILSKYNALPDEEKDKHYSEIQEIYDKIQQMP